MDKWLKSSFLAKNASITISIACEFYQHLICNLHSYLHYWHSFVCLFIRSYAENKEQGKKMHYSLNLILFDQAQLIRDTIHRRLQCALWKKISNSIRLVSTAVLRCMWIYITVNCFLSGLSMNSVQPVDPSCLLDNWCVFGRNLAAIETTNTYICMFFWSDLKWFCYMCPFW